MSQPTHLENKKQEDTIKRTLTLRLIVRGSWEHLLHTLIQRSNLSQTWDRNVVIFLLMLRFLNVNHYNELCLNYDKLVQLGEK